MAFCHYDHSLWYYKEERLLQQVPRWQMIDGWSYVASTFRLPPGNGGWGVRGFKRDTWAKHLFQMAAHISAARGIIDLTCWPVHLRQPADERKTRGRTERVCMRNRRIAWGERERERINEFVPLLAQEPPYTITHNVGFSENICCQQPVSPH